nr:hypothetical protein [Candidatus Freyarchaeota archaeon]
MKTKGFLQYAEDAGIQNLLVDTAVLDIPSIGIAVKAVKLVKKEFGLPIGGGSLNAVLKWKKGNRTGKNAKKVCVAAAITAMMHSGAKWVLYGPIYNSDVVFPMVAMVDSTIACTNSRTSVTNILTKNNPLYQNETQSKFFNALIFSLQIFLCFYLENEGMLILG